MTTKNRRHRPVAVNGDAPESGPAPGRGPAPDAESPRVASHEPDHKSVHNTLAALLTRVTWVLAGPMALFVTLCIIGDPGSGWLAVPDAVYFAIVGLIVWCRWVEQRSGRGATIYGEPTTWDDFNRYLKALLPLALGAWVVANLLGNHILQDGSGP